MNVVIVGGGPTGVELAGAVAELRNNVLPIDYPELSFKNMKVVLIEAGENLLGPMSAEARQKAKDYLEKLGVEVRLKTLVKDYDGKSVRLENEETIETETLLWAAGIKPNKIKGLHEEIYAKNGRIHVNEYSEINGMKDVFALGDISLLQEEKYPSGHPQVAQVALQQAAQLAKKPSQN